MDLFRGITYNVRGLVLGLRTPRLLFLGMMRFLVVVLLALFFSGLILFWHQELLNLVWTMPEPGWLLYLWKVVSWIVSLFLSGLACLFSYFVAQIFFCVFIMDSMSRITERLVTGVEVSARGTSPAAMVFHLIKQEIPRAIIPVLAMVVLMTLGFLTPFGPAIALVSSLVAVTFLAWDNTDLVPARRLSPFKDRFGRFKRNLLFHIGFGLWFLVPWLNILFLSFAPVGGTLYFLEAEKR
jgi:CysZ protein